MDSFWDNLKTRYKQGTVVDKIIYINVAVFVVQALVIVLCRLFGVSTGFFARLLELPASLPMLLRRPWTLLSYMFVHNGLMHLFFNMLWLYFFGRLFLRYFGTRQFLTAYFGGGVAGAVVYLLGYNLLAYYQPMADFSLLAGSSAAILSLTLAQAFYQPDEEINLFMFGRLKMKWLVVAMVVIDLLGLTGDNGGGSLSHLGGALFGLCVGLYWTKGQYRLSGRPSFFDKIFKQRQSAQSKTYHRPSREQSNSDQAYRDRRKADSDRVDAILDKVKASGYDSLTDEEKRFLFESGRK